MTGSKECPICGAPPRPQFEPFCSRRCTEVDLGRWLGGRYVIPTDETPDGVWSIGNADGD